MSTVHLITPQAFSFPLSLEFLKRSPREILHRVEGDQVLKALTIHQEQVLISVSERNGKIVLEFLNTQPSEEIKKYVRQYVLEWFDLETDLTVFYKLAQKDGLLKPLVKKYYGYRIIGQPDLFESLVWAVLGQQINLQFAYTLKQRFIERFGERLEWNDKAYFIFPSPQRVAQLTDADLLPLQFSRQKSKYITLIAQAFESGEISKHKLSRMPLQEARNHLMKVKGVGNWTANYALMKTFRYPDAFPLEDAGLHNALKNQLGLKAKPSLDRVKKIFKAYKGWEAYATLYLWKSL